MKKLLGQSSVVYKALVFVAKRIGSDWPALYRELPFEPQRSPQERDQDIWAARQSNLHPIQQTAAGGRRESGAATAASPLGELPDDAESATEELQTDSVSTPTATATATARSSFDRLAARGASRTSVAQLLHTRRTREQSRDQRAALACFRRWLAWQRLASVEQLYAALRSCQKEQLRRELQLLVHDQGWGWL